MRKDCKRMGASVADGKVPDGANKPSGGAFCFAVAREAQPHHFSALLWSSYTNPAPSFESNAEGVELGTGQGLDQKLEATRAELQCRDAESAALSAPETLVANLVPTGR